VSHGGGGGGLKSAEKVSRIIWMAPNYPYRSKCVLKFTYQSLSSNAERYCPIRKEGFPCLDILCVDLINLGFINQKP
jgi:hypothetical protein